MGLTTTTMMIVFYGYDMTKKVHFCRLSGKSCAMQKECRYKSVVVSADILIVVELSD